MNLILFIIIGMIFLGCSSEEGDWKKAKEINSINSYEAFLKQHDQSKYTDEVKAIIKDIKIKKAFEKAKQLNQIIYLEEFLRSYPSSKYNSEVMEIISELRYGKIIQTKPGGKSGPLVSFGQQNSFITYETKLDSVNDDDLKKYGGNEILKKYALRMLAKKADLGIGDIYCIGGKIYYDIDGNIFNEENVKNKVRLLEVIEVEGQKNYRVLRISPIKGKIMFLVASEWTE